MTRGARAEAVGYTRGRCPRPPATPGPRLRSSRSKDPRAPARRPRPSASRDHLAARGVDVLLTREPGGTWLGERIREVLLARTGVDAAPTDPLTDALLFNAARRQLVGEVIRPAIAAGTTVDLRPLRRFDAGLPGLWRRAAARPPALARGGRYRRAPAGPDDPARPAGRGRARPQGAGRRDPLRGGVRPRVPSAACAPGSWPSRRPSRARFAVIDATADSRRRGARRSPRSSTAAGPSGEPESPRTCALRDERVQGIRSRLRVASVDGRRGSGCAGSHRRWGARCSRRPVRPIQDDGLLDRLPHHE